MRGARARPRKTPVASEGAERARSASGPSAPNAASSLLDLQRATGNALTERMLGGLLVQAKLRGPPDSAAPDAAAPPRAAPVEPAETAATAEPETEPAPQLIVEDAAETVAPGQMKKGDFFARLRPEVCAAAEAGLAGTEHSAQGCPLIEFWLATYEGQDAERINRDLPRFAGEGARPTTAEGYVALIADRVRTGVETWARTGEITGVPPGIPLPGMSLPGLGGLGGLGGLLGGFGGLGGLGGVFFKAQPGGPRQPGDARALQARLGAGRPLDGAVRARMESAFGRSFAQVRLHTDGGAGSLANGLNAHAFAVGEHVAFGAGEYRPGTLVGDALIAHELAHVAQQEGAAAGGAPLRAGGTEHGALERDADLAAAGVTASLWGGARGRLGSLLRPAPRLSSGLRLQRCRRCKQTEEEKQLGASPVPGQIIAGSGFGGFLADFTTALGAATDLAAAQQVVDDHGHRLWRAATQRAQAGGSTDDRPLYWTRLEMTRALRRWDPGFSLSDAEREALIQRLERVSRGMDTATFAPGSGNKRILISGFDPFALHPGAPNPPGTPDPSRGNPSGAAVLALDGTQVSNGSVTGDVEGVVFPVRFADFDAGMVESFFGPYLAPPGAVDMVMTISQGGSDFEVERFAGRRRSADASDNLAALGGGTSAAPVEPSGLATGPEFIESGLEQRQPGATHSPADTIRGELGGVRPLAGETEFEQQPPAPTGATSPDPSARAVAGSGGGYLSNEIFYRTSLLRRRNRSTIPLGHLHTPALRPGSGYSSPGAFARARDAIVSTVKRVLEAVLPDL